MENIHDSEEVLTSLYDKWHQKYQSLAPLKFSRWTNWAKRKQNLNINCIGVYILAEYESADKVPKIADPLQNTLMYIGKTGGDTTSFRSRLSSFHRATEGAYGHVAGHTYREKVGGTPDLDKLWVSMCPLYWEDNPDDKLSQLLGEDIYLLMPDIVPRLIIWLEVCLRGLYVYKWGELPKLNKV